MHSKQVKVIACSIHILSLLFFPLRAAIQRDIEGFAFDARFTNVNKGRLFTTMMYLRDMDLAGCVDFCIRHRQCETVNYNPTERLCELVDYEFDEFETYPDSTGWWNYGTPAKVNGEFSDWITGACSVSCGDGYRYEYRECNNPPPQYGGYDCVGDYTRQTACNDGACPVDGSWSEWKTEEAKCSLSPCTYTIERICNPPVPPDDTFSCLMSDSVTRGLSENKTKPCPICYEDFIQCALPPNKNMVGAQKRIYAVQSYAECVAKCILMGRDKLTAVVVGRTDETYCSCVSDIKPFPVDDERFRACHVREKNFALNKPSKASSFQQLPKKANDGDSDTLFTTKASKEDDPHWWQVHFGTVITISKVTLRLSGKHIEKDKYKHLQIKTKRGENGFVTCWTVLTLTENGKRLRKVNIIRCEDNAKNADTLRVFIAPKNGQLVLAEVEVYGLPFDDSSNNP